MDADTTGLLRDTHGLIARGWTQHADARDDDGVPTEPWAAAANAWSLLGAIVAVLEQHEQREQCELSLHHLTAALDELARLIDDDSLAAWNDHPDRTQRHVLSILDEAARAAFRRPPPAEAP
jgi:hypothetical protein